jgi:hypothetical protein
MIYYINSKYLNLAGGMGANIMEDTSIKDGNWDNEISSDIKSYGTYKGCYEMFIENKDFEDTTLYKIGCDMIEQGKLIWDKYRTLDEFKERGAEIIKLYNSILENGVLDQSTIEQNFINLTVPKKDGKLYDEIIISMDRNGNYVLFNGWHRACIAKVLELEDIPVKVLYIHKIWNDFVNEISDFSNRHWNGKLYQPINHIDFQDYDCIWKDYRFNVMEYHLDPNDKTLVDIGSLFGYMCHKFEEIGLECTAVENHKPYLYFLEKLKKFNNREFKVYKDSIFTMKDFNYDVVLALNIFHHFLKNKEDFNNLKLLLKRMKCNKMFFQPHKYDENQMANSFINFHEDEFCDFIIENSCLNNCTQIGEENGRRLYMLTI